MPATTPRKRMPTPEPRTYDVSDGLVGADEAFHRAVKTRLQKTLLSEDLEMPRISALATRILEIANDPNVDIDRIVKLVQSDPFLAGKLLTLINSSFFAMRQEVTSLRHAVVLLGPKPVGDLIFSASIRMKVFSCKTHHELMESMWQHSVGCAVASEVLTQVSGGGKEPGFLAGLLHDIGKPLVLAAIADTEQMTIPPKRLEKDGAAMLIDHLHVQVGGLLAKKWDLGDALAHTIRRHDVYDPNGPKLTHFVYCGNRIAHHLKMGYKHTEVVPVTDPGFQALKLDKPEVFSRVLQTVELHAQKFIRAT